MHPKHRKIALIVAILIALFLLSFRICGDCGISAKENLTFAKTFIICYKCERRRELEVSERKRLERVKRELEKEREREQARIIEMPKMPQERQEEECDALVDETYRIIEHIADGINYIKREKGTLPNTLEQLNKALEIHIIDAWGTPLQYKRLSDKTYEIHSAGPDGQFGTTDDIAVTRTTRS